MKRIVFHHNDNDGKAAAAVIYQTYKILGYDIDKFISVNYNTTIPISDLIDDGDIVYIVDYSFTKVTVQNLINISKKASELYWFDHHVSSLEVYDDIIKNNICTDVIVNTDICAAYITFNYFVNKGIITNKTFSYMKQILRYVDDYDRWIHKYPESLFFNIGSQCENTEPTSTFWLTIPEFTIEKGRNINDYLIKKNSELTQYNGFIIKINGHECIVLNTPESSSKVFGTMYDKYKFAIRFVFNGKNYSYSIYSQLPDINCAKLAQRFNPRGGGHKGAAGFVSDKILFKEGQVFVI